MKLLLYSHYFAPSIGGVESIVMSLARGLAELRATDGTREFEITLVTQTARADFDNDGQPFRVVRRPRFWKLLSLIRNADVVHLAGPAFFPLALGLLTRKPVIIEHHTYQAICPNGLLIHQPERSVCPGHFQAGKYAECWKCRRAEVSILRSLFDLLFAFPRRSMVRRADANIAVTNHVRQRLAVPHDMVIQHGVEQERSDGDSKAANSTNPAKIRFAFLGRFVGEKGIPVLLKAVSELHREGLEFEVFLIGDGPERSNYESHIREAGIESVVKITGFLSGSDLSSAIAKVQVIVMPSTWEETAGLAAMEQMMRSRLVIASDIGGLAEIIGDAGMKFPVNDSAMLANCMRKVIKEPELINELGQRAQRRAAEMFLRSRMIEEHGSIYEMCYATNQKT